MTESSVSMSPMPYARAVGDATAALAAGRPVVVIDDAERENEADLVMAASKVDAVSVAFMVANTTGILCVPMTGAQLDRLRLPLMVEENTELHATAFTVSVDHVSTTTGVSAADRAATVRALADADLDGDSLRRPGHIFPLRYREGGVLKRAGHTEATIDLLRIAGLGDTGLISELVRPDGAMMREAEARRFAAEHGLSAVTVADVVRWRRTNERLVQRTGEAMLPTEFGTFRAFAYRSVLDGIEHLALTVGDVASQGRSASGVLTRVHSECLTGDAIGSLRCDCGSQLRDALQAIADAGCGALVYLRGHEGRGIGLGHKLRAYELQEGGLDTVEANLRLGFPVDTREYGVGAQILGDLGVRRIRLITNNPAKYGGLGGHDLEIVDRVALRVRVTSQSVSYLRTKRDRLGHLLPGLPDGPLVPARVSDEDTA
jgi:3,4-dihydroxy 2-butanone 4-phosphate synthase/GTP cyclohydrolase II